MSERKRESFVGFCADDPADAGPYWERFTATLDGNPAVISGAREPFATVSTLAGITQAQWAWPTVARIVANGGAFRS